MMGFQENMVLVLRKGRCQGWLSCLSRLRYLSFSSSNFVLADSICINNHCSSCTGHHNTFLPNKNQGMWMSSLHIESARTKLLLEKLRYLRWLNLCDAAWVGAVAVRSKIDDVDPMVLVKEWQRTREVHNSIH